MADRPLIEIAYPTGVPIATTAISNDSTGYAGLLVIECEQPNRKARRGRGKSDPIDAHLAVLTALRCDTERLPTPRADGDREALRILLAARHDLTNANTAQTNRLRTGSARCCSAGTTSTGRPLAARSPTQSWPR